MSFKSKATDEKGIALITAMLVLMLVSALMAGMFASIQSDLREAATDRDQTQAYAAAHAGLEQLTSGLAQLFMRDVSPSTSAIQGEAATPPTIPGFDYVAPGGTSGSGFTITFQDVVAPIGTPDILPNTAITTGPFTGFMGMVTPYTMTVTARSTTGKSEVRLRRGLQTVAVPVFQFGMFSETDLSVFSGGGFRFGGRVHTNGSLFVAAQTSGTATNNIVFSDRVTAVRDVIRNFLSNSRAVTGTSPSFNNEVRFPTGSSTNEVLRQTPNMGSVSGMPGSAPNGTPDPWVGISTGTFKSYLRNGTTGATRLDLPLVSQGAQPIDLIRRPRLNSDEKNQNSQVYAQRFYGQAGLRIMLSDRPEDFNGLPTLSAGAPVWLGAADGGGNDWRVAPPAGYVVDATRPPIARSIGPASAVTLAAGGNGGILQGSVSQFYVANNNAAIPDLYKLPVTITVNTAPAQTLTCLGKTGETAITSPANLPANAFLNCTTSTVPSNRGLTAAVPVGTTITASVDGRPVTATVAVAALATAAPPAASTSTLIVGANQTAPFSQTNLLWVNRASPLIPDGQNISVPVSCEGYSDVPVTISGTQLRRFLACRGISATPASNLLLTTSAVAARDSNRIGGYLKVERQDAAGNWTDVTMEILNLGIGDRNGGVVAGHPGGAGNGGTLCPDPSPLAVLRIQRLRDNGGGTCTYGNSMNSYDWWPQTLYDAREGSFRDSQTSGGAVHSQNSPMTAMGVMQYVALDVANLKRWLSGAIGTTGTTVRNDDGNGYIVYFSDRRGNHDPGGVIADEETGEFGFEDFINSTTAAGTPDGILQAGEDVNVGDPRWPANSQQLYGQTPWNNPLNIPTTSAGAFTTLTRPWTPVLTANGGGAGGLVGAGQARVSKVVLFRRALKLVNGGIVGGVNSLPDTGLTVAAENPVYVHGNYNADLTVPADPAWSNMEPNRPAAVIADAVMLLSNNWSDARSFEAPNAMWSRAAGITAYRFAAIAGKGLSFPYCFAACGNPGDLFGTDGGAGNFFRLLEDWSAPGATVAGNIRYRGSIVSLHNNRQAVGAYKFSGANNHHYNAGPRNFTFDADFLIPDELPPGTPMFRDINTLQFRQILRPNQ